MRPPRRTMQPIGQQTAERDGSQPIFVPPVAATAAPVDEGALQRPAVGSPANRAPTPLSGVWPRASEAPVNVPVFDTTEEELA